MPLFVINIVLAAAWAAVSGSFDPLNIVFGFVLGAGALWLIREQTGSISYFVRSWRGLVLGGILLYEIVNSSLRVAFIVLFRVGRLQPAIIAYPLSLQRDFEITLLANLVTLTPGTLSIDVSRDRKILYIHCIDAPDTDAVIAGIRKSFEGRILAIFPPESGALLARR